MLRFKLRYEITCNTCLNDSSNEESSSPLQLAVSNSIQTALNSSLETETLSGDNSIYCNFLLLLKISLCGSCIFGSRSLPSNSTEALCQRHESAQRHETCSVHS